jgi:hypothetical protein
MVKGKEIIPGQGMTAILGDLLELCGVPFGLELRLR